jgi:hypothetical protein
MLTFTHSVQAGTSGPELRFIGKLHYALRPVRPAIRCSCVVWGFAKDQ